MRAVACAARTPHLPVALTPLAEQNIASTSSRLAARRLSSSSSSPPISRGVRIASVRVASLRVLPDTAAHVDYDTRVLTAHDLSRPSGVSDALFSGERQGATCARPFRNRFK
jgi:hypothetical protein